MRQPDDGHRRVDTRAPREALAEYNRYGERVAPVRVRPDPIEQARRDRLADRADAPTPSRTEDRPV